MSESFEHVLFFTDLIHLFTRKVYIFKQRYATIKLVGSYTKGPIKCGTNTLYINNYRS